MKKTAFYKYAKELGIDNLIVDKILQKKLDISSKDLFLLDEINEPKIPSLKKDLNKLKKGIPLEYILGKAEFYSLVFNINKNALIPRNDTEVLTWESIKEIKKYPKITLLDIGTGSGNIPISIAKNSNNIKNIYVTEKSKKALKIAQENFEKYNLSNKSKFFYGSLLLPLLSSNLSYEKDIIITANLPYIKNKDYMNMSKQTFMFEPTLALFGGNKTGFELYEKLMKQIFKFKKIYNPKNLLLFIEIGFDQYEYSKEYFEKLGLKTKYYKDNSGIYRCIKITF